MLKERKLSNRKLADQLGVSEGTIRNHRDYAKAAKLRNRYAPEGADELISGLNTKQVAAYLSLKEKGNEWLMQCEIGPCRPTHCPQIRCQFPHNECRW